MNKEKSEQILKTIIKENPAVKALDVDGGVLTEKKVVEIFLTVTDKHTNVHGIVHGGVYVTLLDTAMGCACYCSGEDISCVTLDITTSFISNCKPGTKVTTIGRVVHAGRRIMVTEGEVVDENGKLLVKSQGTFFVLNND